MIGEYLRTFISYAVVTFTLIIHSARRTNKEVEEMEEIQLKQKKARLIMAKTECSSIIVGKNVSKTGKIIAGHNEDNRGLLVMPQYYFPRQKHNKMDIT